jgi:crotonobetainyl-CoA:carnitine CoA-transferase CaiB-like acyl-CoA transferase
MSSHSEIMMTDRALPLEGLKVVEFTHMVMGPAVGVILGDLGADVIRVEPPEGDRTRNLLGSGAGYFPMYNRNKRSVFLNLKDESELSEARGLCEAADIVIENFRPGTLDRLGLSYEAIKAINPGVIYCSAKGFLKGPYENRAALDEVTQMMGGLAYMTGPPGKPLRAGASVIDVTGGMFGVIGILAALERRHRDGEGAYVQCALYETTAFLVGQHMAQKAVTGKAAAPMPVRISAWAVYDVFETANENEQVFVGVVSDAQWRAFCDAFELPDLLADSALQTNNQRVSARDSFMPAIRAMMNGLTREALLPKLEAIGLPFAPIARPEDLFDDPQLNAGGLVEVTLPSGEKARLPGLPITFDGERLPLRHDLAVVAGA